VRTWSQATDVSATPASKSISLAVSAMVITGLCFSYINSMLPLNDYGRCQKFKARHVFTYTYMINISFCYLINIYLINRLVV